MITRRWGWSRRTRRPSRRPTFAAVAAAITLAILTGCSASSSSRQAAPIAHDGLTAKQQRVALRLAQSEVRRLARTVVSISATIGPGSLPLEESNSGHACTSGTVLHIRVIGAFNTVVSPPPSAAPGASPADYAVTAEEITADATTSDICLTGVRVGRVAPDAGATILLQE